jgi:hypothetical protein
VNDSPAGNSTGPWALLVYSRIILSPLLYLLVAVLTYHPSWVLEPRLVALAGSEHPALP